MDPTTNPTPTPNPAPAPAPGAAPAPVAPTPAPEAPTAPAPEASAAPASAPALAPAPAPAAPAVTPNPTPATAAGGMTTPPVNPIINPTANPMGAPTATQPDGLAATDPIMMPDPVKAPDPVEEELKTPMKAAAPAPGSIGSAVSGPVTDTIPSDATAPTDNPFASSDKKTPNVSFNDPALQSDATAAGGNTVVPAKKKTNKTTLIALIIVAVMIVIALAAVLIFQLIGDNSSSQVSNTPNNQISEPANNTNTTNNTNNTNTTNNTTTTSGTLSCARNMTATEIARLNDAASGTISVSAEFDNQNMLTKIALTEMVTYSDENSVSNEPVENAVHEALASDLTTDSAAIYFLPTDSTGALDLTKKSIQTNYESLDFVCEVL